MAEASRRLSNVNVCVDEVIDRVGKDIRLGLPLGLGKPIHFVNALYQRAKDDPEIHLHIATALSLVAPQGGSSLEGRFIGPFTERLYGQIPELAYARDALDNRLPGNVTVSEFFFKAGSYLHNPPQQQQYVCSNYTHAVRDLMAQNINVVAQLVSPGDAAGESGLVSLSCNPDLSLDLFPLMREKEAQGTPVALVAELNDNLPYMVNDALVKEHSFDVVYEHKTSDYPLFPAPQMAVGPEEHLIGFYASALLKDGGTLQVGIGTLGTALVYSTILRHRQNDAWRAMFDRLRVAERFPLVKSVGGSAPFDKGLYGCSEMMVDGFLHLMQAGVLSREVYGHAGLQELINRGAINDHVSLNTLDVLRQAQLIRSPLRARDVSWLVSLGVLNETVEFKGGRLKIGEQSVEGNLDDPAARETIEFAALGDRLKGGIVMHGGFYVGPESFYHELRQLTPEQRSRVCMTSVNYINHLYDHRLGNQRLKQSQRAHGRFVNSTMMYTLSGAAVSDGLDDGRVVSGVGGQYNFVSMAHELPDARSILTLRATRKSSGKVVSNIVFNYAHCTIPRHLRDIVITEYGIADLRSRNDEQVYLSLIRIADSRFQKKLLKQAQSAGKVSAAFRLPESWCNNTPEVIRTVLSSTAGGELFQAFPFGKDFTDDELVLGRALKRLKSATATRRGKLATLWQAMRVDATGEKYQELLARMSLENPARLKDKLSRRLLIRSLEMSDTPTTKGN